MSDDILSEATRALREETLDSDESTRFTRNRVMASLHRRDRRRRSRIVWLLPIAAVLAGTTAFASSGSGWHAVAAAIGIADPPPPAPIATLARQPLRRAPARVLPPPAPEPEAEPPAPEAEPEPPLAEARPAPSPASSASAPPIAPDPTLAIYREAHRLHFGSGDSAAALAAWDRYLASAPRGRFSVEARYNRAICLVRLGRRDEALAALAPFAQGAYGAYRQSSARELVRSLGGESEPAE